ncbi:MAG: hypothetical protein A2538_01945 [Candidatus Magasanikbacteria bacterium RIFOXYD2_FULL_41_14]|uniref:Band 7 domain-containing protein n=1 Tax=Candidatus Magasanikbacteria bacterium RIFOXYD2_FULL_41_14 TaxID=1798709 RepID=A0A1F6PCH8_9BACT|nr:MAG: hypothetical protein A2538_01945 [Candidatus Magasanikbacteria bacterium RIFOXYD2_FULL_41_14]
MIQSEKKNLLIAVLLIFVGIISRSPVFVIIAIFIFWFWYKKNASQYGDGVGAISAIFQDIFIPKAKVINSNESKSSFNFNSNSMNDVTVKAKRAVLLAGGAVVVLLILVRAVVIVPAGYVGVFHLFGKVSDKPVYSGLNLINPLGSVEKMSIRTEDYTMSIVSTEGNKSGNDAISALTKEGLNVDLDITVLFHLIPEKASEVYRTIGMNYHEVVIRPEIRSAIREVVAQYEAKDIYSEKRGEAAVKILEALKTKIEPRGVGVEEVLLRNVALPKNLATSIESKLQAEQESQRYDFVLEKETKEAERKRIEAAGQRDAQQIITQGLTTPYLNYLYIQNLKDSKGTIYVPTNPSNGTPLFRSL